jgi:hypothetical protein
MGPSARRLERKGFYGSESATADEPKIAHRFSGGLGFER